MTHTIFDFNDEPRGDLLKTLLLGSTELAATCGLVIQEDFPSSPRATRLAAGLRPYTKAFLRVSSWPGTQLHDEHRAVQHQFSFSIPVAELLFEAAEGLYDWISPDLPEDLHLLRQDGSVLLGCVAHEHDAWLELDREELAQLQETAPGLAQLLTARNPS